MGGLIFRSKSSRKTVSDGRQIFGFPGGIHPPEHKTDSNTVAIRRANIPTQLVLPLAQHVGAPAEAVVNAGDRVLKGQLVAKAKGLVSANLHAPTSGTVIAIELRPVQHPSGLPQPCIVIAADGRDEWVARSGIADWKTLQPEDILGRIRDAGITGMGGAGFPSAVKNAPRKPIGQLILNAVECEPYITADDRLMRERAAGIIEGLKILRHVLNAREVLVGIEDNKPEAITAMQTVAHGSGIEIVVVPTKYPSGGEKQLIQNLTGKEVPSGGLPADVGVICTNTGTSYAVFRAVVKGEPLISRITTLTGEALTRRGNVEALIGTPVIDLLLEAGLNEPALHRLVMGGPMMGFTLHNAAVPLVKSTNCLIAATVKEMPDPPPEQACIRCGACAEVCPASLLPQQLYWFSKSGELEKAQDFHVMDCIECGACAYVCPSSIPLVQYYRHTKGDIRKKQAEDKKAEKAKLRFEARQARIDREIAEREAKRKARADAARTRSAAPAEIATGNAAPAVDEALLARLKQTSLAASGEYKAAVKALKEAEAAGNADTAALQRHIDELKARADAAKAAVRSAQQGSAPGEAAADEPAAKSAPAVDLEKLKHQVGEASSAYKAAVRAAKEAEDAGADNAAELRAQAEQCKQLADDLKVQLRHAKAEMPPGDSGMPSVPANTAVTTQTALTGTDPEVTTITTAVAPATSSPPAPVISAEQMKLLKTAVATSNKQYKDAVSALEISGRNGVGDIAAMQARVAGLKQKADEAKAALETVIAQMKNNAGHSRSTQGDA